MYKEKNIQVMNYMGNKRVILDEIIPKIKNFINKDKAFLDLFCGTSSVGFALKPFSIIYSNDIQEYGKVIAEGIIKNYNKENLKEDLDIIKSNYIINKKELDKILKVPLEKEKYYINCEVSDENMINYNHYLDTYPYYLSGQTGYGLENWITNEIDKRKENPSLFPYILCSMYYSNGFYGVNQSIDIDSIRYGIDKIKNEENKSFFLTILLYAMSSSITSTGHYSQYRNVNSLKSYKEIQKIKNKDVYQKFLKKFDETIYKIIDNSKLESSVNLTNKAFKDNYLSILNNEEIMKNVGLIYADPPYNKDNYSKYYHVPESIALYDYPELIMHRTEDRVSNGRYREDTYRSPFCKRREAYQAFEELIENSSKWKIPLIISYSDNAIVSIEELDKLISKYYDKKQIYSFSHKHSRLGREGMIELKEYLIIGFF